METWLIRAAAILAAVMLGAFAWRWRGTGSWHLLPGRILCAGLIAAPALLHDWRLGLAVAVLSWRGASTDHDPSGRNIAQNTDSGLFLTGWASLEAASRGDWISAGLLAGAGLLKGLLYRLPAGPAPDLKFVWRELAFGAVWGAAVGASLWPVY